MHDLSGYDDWLDNYGNPGIREDSRYRSYYWGLLVTIRYAPNLAAWIVLLQLAD